MTFQNVKDILDDIYGKCLTILRKGKCDRPATSGSHMLKIDANGIETWTPYVAPVIKNEKSQYGSTNKGTPEVLSGISDPLEEYEVNIKDIKIVVRTPELQGCRPEIEVYSFSGTDTVKTAIVRVQTLIGDSGGSSYDRTLVYPDFTHGILFPRDSSMPAYQEGQIVITIIMSHWEPGKQYVVRIQGLNGNLGSSAYTPYPVWIHSYSIA